MPSCPLPPSPDSKRHQAPQKCDRPRDQSRAVAIFDNENKKNAAILHFLFGESMLFSLSRSCYIAPYSLGANWGGRCSRLRPAGLFNFGCSMYKAPIDYQAARLFYGCNEVSCHCFRLRATAPQPPQHTRYPNSLAAKLRPSSPATTYTPRHTRHDTHTAFPHTHLPFLFIAHKNDSKVRSSRCEVRSITHPRVQGPRAGFIYHELAIGAKSRAMQRHFPAAMAV